MTRVRVTPRRGNLPSKVIPKTTKHDKILVGNHGYHYNKAGKAYTLYYCEYRSKQGCNASLQLYNDGTRIRHEEHTCHPPPASIEAQTIRKPVYLAEQFKDQKMFEAKLPNASLLKKIVDAIKDLVNDVPFDCTENAMMLQAMDASHVALVALRLNVELFDTYRCDRTMNIGVSVQNLTRALKCASSEDSCMIKYDESDNLVFTFVDEKRDRSQDVTVKLMDIDHEQLGIPEQQYNVIIEMPSHEFQKICRDLSMFSDSLSINATKGGITFKAAGDQGNSTVNYNSSVSADDAEKISFEVREAVNTTFSIKYLNQFAKATSLSDRVRLSICNDVPIAIEYTIKSTDGEENGYLRYYLAPKIEDDANMD